MAAMSATEAKNKFGQMLEKAQAEPVHIQKDGRQVAVVISYDRFRALEEAEKAAGSPIFDRLLKRSIERRKSLYEALAK